MYNILKPKNQQKLDPKPRNKKVFFFSIIKNTGFKITPQGRKPLDIEQKLDERA